MKISKKLLCASLLLVSLVGCTTNGTFVVPEDTSLYIYERPSPVIVKDDGKVTTKPYFWSAFGGVPYRLEKDGETVKEGKLRAKFRVVSIFWPPYAIIYWPAGLDPDIEYDLINDTQDYISK